MSPRGRINHLIPCAVGFIVCALVLSNRFEGEGFGKYCNDRFGFCMSFPVNLQRKIPPMNGDGQGFYDKSGFILSGSGSNSTGTIEEMIELDSTLYDAITYRAVGKSWFTLSGYKGTRVLYTKTFFGRQSSNTLYIEYPLGLKKTYDPIVSTLSRSFKPGNLSVGH